ncbi:MAG TPA: C-terminal binding protein [Stellaceae bacterium]
MTRFRILTPDAQYADDATVERETAGPDYAFEIHRVRAPAELPAGLLEAADALLVWHEFPIDAAVISRLNKCRIIVRGGVGFDHIDLRAAGAAGIPVCNTPDYGTSEVADHAIGLLLALARGIPQFQDELRADIARPWRYPETACMRRIRGTTLGLVGLGRIGTATALRAKGFGLDLVGYDPYLPRGQEIALGVRRVESLEELLQAGDAVSLHCPLNDETRGMIGDAAFAAMRPHAVLINTARGGIVDLGALHRALETGRIAGAALDVLPEEPPSPEEPLMRAFREQREWLRGRFLLTPHAAWNSPESRHDARRLSAETMALYLRNGTLRNCVNAELIDRSRLRPG